MEIKVSNTMKAENIRDKNVHYIVIKLGDKFYSTTFSEIKTGKDIEIAKEQLADTKGIGIQKNTWIVGKFTETNKHEKLSEPLPSELNIYEGAGE